MNINEATKYLGLSERTLRNYVGLGKIPARRLPGKTNPVLDFQKEDLDKLLRERQSPSHHPTVIESPKEKAEAFISNLPDIREEATFNALKAYIRAFQSVQTIPADRKLLLTLKEVQSLTGLSRDTVKAAIIDKKLKAQVIGRGWKIKKMDLEQWIAVL